MFGGGTLLVQAAITKIPRARQLTMAETYFSWF